VEIGIVFLVMGLEKALRILFCACRYSFSDSFAGRIMWNLRPFRLFQEALIRRLPKYNEQFYTFLPKNMTPK